MNFWKDHKKQEIAEDHHVLVAGGPLCSRKLISNTDTHCTALFMQGGGGCRAANLESPGFKIYLGQNIGFL